MSGKSLSDVRFAKARDVMTKDIVCIDGSATVAEAVQMMREESVSSLIVNRRNPDDAWGIVTQKDVVTKVVDPGKRSAEVRVFEIMSKPLITVAPGLALKYCARLFCVSGIRRAPVFDGKAIVGILSNTDIFNAIQDESHLIVGVLDETDPVEDLTAEPPSEIDLAGESTNSPPEES
jgi:CBS domain-containing protein